MSEFDWQSVERVLAEVMDLPPEDRGMRVTELCGDQAELRAEVESLLAAHDRAASFLKLNTQIDSSTLSIFSLQGRQLGPYRLLEIRGVGGMGTVYRAERTDGRFQKSVAIKVMHAVLHSPE